MSISEILRAGANVQLVVNAADLREAFLEWASENRPETSAQMQENYLTAGEVSRMLGVDLSTLWRWHRDGYLTKVKWGNKTRYRESDIKRIMEG